MKKRLLSLFTLCLLLVIMCSVPVHAKIRLNKTKKTLMPGQFYKLKVKGTKKKVKWSSSKKSVATVTKKGKVKAKKPGTCTIKAVVAGKKLKCKIKVDKVITDVQMSPNITVKVGETKEIPVTIKPSNFGRNSLFWWTDNPAIASVAQGGKVTGVSVGTITVGAFAIDSGAQGTCKVTVVADKETALINSYNQLVAKIKQSSRVNKSGEHLFIKTATYKGAKYGSAIVYDNEKDEIRFTTELDTEKSAGRIDMFYNLSAVKADVCTLEYRQKQTGTEKATTLAVGSIHPSSYGKNSQEVFTVKYTNLANPSILQDTCNIMTKLLISECNDLAYENTGVSMKDLGFTAFY